MEKPLPLDKEIVLDSSKYIVSKTDPKGVITYANDYFKEISGYNEDELIGKPHNIIRHPDMPKIIFKFMWDRINQGKNIKAIVKNLAKDGRYYWVLTDFEPLYDPVSKKIISHTAYRKAAPRKAVEAMIPLYSKLVLLEKEGGMKRSGDFLDIFFEVNSTDYDKFIEEKIRYNGVLRNFFEKMKKMF